MTARAKALLDEVLRLPEKERARLAAALLESIDDGADPRAEGEWAEEIERRARKAIAGESPWHPLDAGPEASEATPALMKPVAFSVEAADEVYEAYCFYERRAVGLGDDLRREADVQLRRIAENPSLYARAPRTSPSLSVRRAPLVGFPYSIVYIELAHEVRVLAFAHQRKRPRYWRGRVR